MISQDKKGNLFAAQQFLEVRNISGAILINSRFLKDRGVVDTSSFQEVLTSLILQIYFIKNV